MEPENEDLILDVYHGSRPEDAGKELVEKADHEHVWEGLASPWDEAPAWEVCLLCRIKRRIEAAKRDHWIPPVRSSRTGY